jgi:hypothetical protein
MNMNELVTLISQKTGLSSDMAQQVLTVIQGYVKDKVPEPMASQVNNVLTGQMGGMSATANPEGANQPTSQGKSFLGNLFGGKSENQPTEH